MARFMMSRWGKWTTFFVAAAFSSILPGPCTNSILRLATPFLI